MKRWIGLAVAGGVLCVAPLFFRGGAHAAQENAADADETEELSKQKSAGFEKKVTPPPLTGLELLHEKIQDDGVTAPAHGERVAHLTLDPGLQKFAHRALEAGGAQEAAVVLTDVKTGRVIVYASRLSGKEQRDLNVESNAPAASVFKIVTASALVERADLNAETRQCYWGGEHRIEAQNLVEDPRKDKWCATMAEAMGRSLNVVFARLAQKNLDKEKLGGIARSYGFGDSTPFDVDVAADTLAIPDDSLGFARTSAGFWNTTLSPISAAELAMTVANRGVRIKPFIVDTVTEGDEKLYRAAHRQVLGRAVKAETAAEVTKMMEDTVANGTSYKAFHDGAGKAYIPGVSIAGKTGTLAKQTTDQLYTWFVGFAPSQSPEVAISVLVVNHGAWKVKANTVAREMLQAYFAGRGAPGVVMPH